MINILHVVQLLNLSVTIFLKLLIFNLGSHYQRVSTVGTHRFGIRVLLRLDFGHTVCCYVVPSIRYFSPHLSFNRAEFVHEKGNVNFNFLFLVQ